MDFHTFAHSLHLVGKNIVESSINVATLFAFVNKNNNSILKKADWYY